MLLKKLLLLGTLVSVSLILCMESGFKRSHAGPEVSEEQVERVTIQTQEGQKFNVEAELVKLSETLKNLIEDAGTDLPLPLPNITGDTWATIQNLLPYVRDIKRGAQDAQQNKDTISAALKSLNGTSLIEFIIAVNYLDISILLALAIDVAKQIDIKKITPAQIAALPKEIRNPIIFAQIIKILGPLADPSLQAKQTVGKHSVFSVDVTPDGSKIVSGADDKTIRVWDIKGLKQLKLFKSPDKVRSVSISPDGSKIVTGSFVGSVCVMNIDTGKQLHVFFGHSNSVLSVYVTPDGSKIVSGSADDTIRIWDINTDAAVAILKGHTRSVNSVFVTPDGKSIISGSDDTTIRIWDINTYKQLFELKGHTGPVKSVCVTPEGGSIVSGSSDNTVRVWDINTHEQLFNLIGSGPINSVCVTQDGSKIIASSTNAIQIWDRKSHKLLSNFIVPNPQSLRVTPDGNKIIAGSTSNWISLFDISVLNRLPNINSQQADGIWSYLQGDHQAGWQPIINMSHVLDTIVIPPALSMPVLPAAPRSEGESVKKRHKPGE